MKETKTKKSFYRWIYPISTAVLLLLAAVLVLSGKVSVERQPEQVELEKKQENIVVLDASDEAPEETPTEEGPVLPAGAVEIRVNRAETGLIFSTQREAEMLLESYLNNCLHGTVENERIIKATFAEDISFYNRTGTGEVTTFPDAMKSLQDNPGLVPVKVITEKEEYSTGDIQKETQESKRLPQGSRMINSLGRGEKKLIRTEQTYIAGRWVESGEAREEILFDAYPARILTGQYQSERPDGEPGKKEGLRSRKDVEGKLVLPIQSKASSFFGIRNNIMHYGMDIPAKAGTEILAPGDGLVVFVGLRGAYGTVIDIDHENGCVSRLTHCNDVRVELNQRVFQKDVVATLAESETGTGKPHLHYELIVDGIPENPMFYVA